jgi:hypothetical protein
MHGMEFIQILRYDHTVSQKTDLRIRVKRSHDVKKIGLTWSEISAAFFADALVTDTKKNGTPLRKKIWPYKKGKRTSVMNKSLPP